MQLTLSSFKDDGECRCGSFVYTPVETRKQSNNYFICTGTSSSGSSSDSNSDRSDINEENDVLDDEDIEPPVFDSSKENDYVIKYSQTFEEVVSLDDVYILNLDAQKQ